MAGNPQRRDKAREIALVVRKLRGSDDLVSLVIVTATDPTAPVPPLTEKVVICDDPDQLFSRHARRPLRLPAGAGSCGGKPFPAIACPYGLLAHPALGHR